MFEALDCRARYFDVGGGIKAQGRIKFAVCLNTIARLSLKTI